MSRVLPRILLVSAFALSAPALSVSAAFADQQGAQACAAGLDPESKTIYDEVAPQVNASTDLRDVITASTRSLVASGKVARSSARTSAEAAGACLEKLKS